MTHEFTASISISQRGYSCDSSRINKQYIDFGTLISFHIFGTFISVHPVVASVLFVYRITVERRWAFAGPGSQEGAFLSPCVRVAETGSAISATPDLPLLRRESRSINMSPIDEFSRALPLLTTDNYMLLYWIVAETV